MPIIKEIVDEAMWNSIKHTYNNLKNLLPSIPYLAVDKSYINLERMCSLVSRFPEMSRTEVNLLFDAPDSQTKLKLLH